MYFPKLQHIQELDGINTSYSNLITELDIWLATRRPQVKNYLTPYSFSKYSNTDINISMELFYLATLTTIKVLRVRFDLIDKFTNTNLGSFYSEKSIPEKIYHPEYDTEVETLESNIEVYFELIAEPIGNVTFIQNDDPGKTLGVSYQAFKEMKRGFTLSSIYGDD